jgi:hypothetical protein
MSRSEARRGVPKLLISWAPIDMHISGRQPSLRTCAPSDWSTSKREALFGKRSGICLQPHAPPVCSGASWLLVRLSRNSLKMQHHAWLVGVTPFYTCVSGEAWHRSGPDYRPRAPPAYSNLVPSPVLQSPYRTSIFSWSLNSFISGFSNGSAIEQRQKGGTARKNLC